jgi:cell filamentation protein
LIDNPLSGESDLAHLKAIHRYMFQDVYEWAGQFRTVNISKGGRLFGLADFLEPSLQQVLTKLAAEKHLVNLDADTFAGRAAYFLGELNAAHPFREGNGRMQREFIREQGLKAGHYIDWRAATAEEMIEASQVSQGRRVKRCGILPRDLLHDCLHHSRPPVEPNHGWWLKFQANLAPVARPRG